MNIFGTQKMQHFEIKALEDINQHNQTVIEGFQEEIDTKEYKAFDKCKGQGVFLAKCIEWELGK